MGEGEGGEEDNLTGAPAPLPVTRVGSSPPWRAVSISTGGGSRVRLFTPEKHGESSQ